MTQTLRRRVEAELERAHAWKEGRDPTPVFEALGYALTLRALDMRELLSPTEAKQLKGIGARALLGFTSPDTEREDGEADRLAFEQMRGIARAGLAALGSGRHERAKVPELHPPSRTLVRMLGGELDGLSAGRYAAHMLGCASCQAEVEVLRSARSTRGATSGLAIAAAKPASVRAPAQGRVIATHDEPAVEAVLFDDDDARRMAVYAQANVTVQLVADGVVTEETLSGYWLGRIEGEHDALEATVHVGDESFEWRLNLATG